METNLRQKILTLLQAIGKPLHISEISKYLLDTDQWQTSGKTPWSTVAACIYTDIKSNGSASSFLKTGPQTFGLKKPLPAASDPAVELAANDCEPSESKGLLTLLKAAEKVLCLLNSGQPLHYRDITAKALTQGWLTTQGRTPEATMNAQLITEIRRRSERGDHPLFQAHGRGYYSLTTHQADTLTQLVEAHNQIERKKLLDYLYSLTPKRFEELITAELLPAMDVIEITHTGRSGDGGVDIRGTFNISGVIRTKIAVQVKRWKANVQRPTVQQLRGSLGPHENGLIITTSDFSEGAKIEALRDNATPISLMNGEQLVSVCLRHQIGSRRSTLDLFYFFEDDMTR